MWKKYYADLYELLAVPDNMSAIAPRLYSEELITDDTLDNINSTNSKNREKAYLLLRALKATIDTRPQSLKTLIEVLKRNDAFKVIVNKMDQETLYCFT